MYSNVIRIGLFGIDGNIIEALRSVETPERFKIELNEHASCDAEALATCDIAIVSNCSMIAREASRINPEPTPHPNEETSSRAAWGKTLSANAAKPCYVLCADVEEAEKLDADGLRLLEDLWMAPLNAPHVAFRFEKLLERRKLAAELELHQQYLDTMIDSIPELIWFKDARGSHLKVNDAFCKVVGKTKEQVEGRGHYFIWDITPDEYAQGEYVCLESEDETMQARKTCLFDEQVKTKHGMRQFKTYKSPLFDVDGTVMGTVGIAHDVTDLGNIETELNILIDSMPYSVVVLDTEGIVLNINEMTEEYFNVSREEVLGGNFEQWRRIVLTDAVVDSNDFSDKSFFSATIGGVQKTFEVNQALIKDVFDNLTGQLRIYRDVTHERELERRAIKNANTDYLTGLHNRRYFYSYLDKHRENNPITLISIDLNDFKSTNDLHGHAAGDKALSLMAEALNSTFGEELVARWGGDEFVVALLGDRSPDDVEATVRNMLEQLEHESKAAGNPWSVAASAGIAATKDPDMAIDELIRHSDEALYRAKRDHRAIRVARAEWLEE